MPQSSTHSRCPACKKHWPSLLIRAKRHENAAHPSDNTNHQYLPGPVLVDRLQKMSARIREQSRQITRLKQRLEEDIEMNGVTVSEETQTDISQIVQQNASFIDTLHPNSFNRLFWEEQMKALMKSKAKGHRFHPLLVRLGLYLHHLSPGAYKVFSYASLHHMHVHVVYTFILCMYVYEAYLTSACYCTVPVS